MQGQRSDGGAELRFATAGTALTPSPEPLAALPRQGSARARETRAMLVSLLVHVLLLSLLVGGQGEGWPGLAFPWQARRAEVPDLRVVLNPGPQPLPVPEQLAADEAPPPSAVSVEAPGATTVADAAPPPPAPPALIAVDRPADAHWAVPPTPPASAPVLAALPSASSPLTRLAVVDLSLRVDTRERPAEQARLDAARQEIQQKGEKLEAARMEAERQAAARVEAEKQEAARQATARQEAERAEAERQEATRRAAAQQEAARQEAAKAEAARQETERQEAARRAAAQQEATRQEAARQDAARAEAARQETERQEAARRAAAQQEAARQEAAKAEAARQEAARVEAARQEGARQEAARAEAARAEAARLQAAKAQEEQQREARLRAIGQQLNEEAAKRDAARQAQSNLPSSWSSLRRGRLFGRTDANAEMVQYAEAWARKIQFNQTWDLVRDALKPPYTDPLVTVAIRADGTVESVNFYRSSGVPALDEAIRRVIESQANYPAFPPALARDYDVIEIRRTWHFDTAIRLY